MAYDQLNKFTDTLAEEHLRLASQPNTSRQLQILFDLCTFHDTVLQNAQFKGQRQHCKEIITKLNPGYAAGYFKKQKS